MGTVIYILLANYTLTLLALGLMAAGISLWGRPRPLMAWIVLNLVPIAALWSSTSVEGEELGEGRAHRARPICSMGGRL
jgi:hypothetical protein